MTTPLIVVRQLRVEARRAEFEALPHARLMVSAASAVENLVHENATLLRQLQIQANAFGKWCDSAGLEQPTINIQQKDEVSACS